MKAIIKGDFDKLLKVAEALDQFDSVGDILKMEVEKHSDGSGRLILEADEKSVKTTDIPYKFDIFKKQITLDLSGKEG